MDMLRKVKYTSIIGVKNDEYFIETPKDGFFHEWGHGKDSEGDDLTYAIIEDAENGKVYKVYSDHIQFLK